MEKWNDVDCGSNEEFIDEVTREVNRKIKKRELQTENEINSYIRQAFGVVSPSENMWGYDE